MIIDEDNYLMHYGILRKSGRYPWGSGNDQATRNRDFLDYVDGLRKQGLSDTEICKGISSPDRRVTTTQLRASRTIAINQQKQEQIRTAQSLRDKGMSNVAIGTQMGINESSVRSLLAPGAKDRAEVLTATAKVIKDAVEEQKYVDIGAGVEQKLQISGEKLKAAVALLQEDGYKKHYLKVPQVGTGKETSLKVLTKDDVTYKEVLANRDKIEQPRTNGSEDGGRTYSEIHPPLNISSKRVGINYAETGGDKLDGVIYVRPGVKDVELGKAPYAQVRIAVDGTHYLKGMAMYKSDLPNGVDLMFNTNKSDTGNKLDAMKKQSDDVENPFGATTRQIPGENGKPSSVMNIVNEAGKWDSWSKTLSTQFLSKQSSTLAKQQLDLTYDKRKNGLDEILKLTNPAVKTKLLHDFAEDADSAAVHMKAASLPRQATKVILPINSLKDNEVFAPTFKNGERVVLIRHPHAGTFEIPELTVNNNNKEGINLLGKKSEDAIGINSKVAARLSGADFDGDTVLVIPNNSRVVKTSPALEGLKNFDPHQYKVDGPPTMNSETKGIEMGKISNLIADMTIRDATHDELARAVRHSMVVIDAEKHNYDYKASAKANGINALKIKYQGGAAKGASTLITRAKTPVTIDQRKARPAAQGGAINKETGKKEFVPTGNSFVGRDGNVVVKKERSKLLAETENAHDLSSGSVIEAIYANHSNKLKDLANQARLAQVNTKPQPYSPSAKVAHAAEVKSLNAKLNLARANAPLERQAQLLANAAVAMRKQADPEMSKETYKKIQGQELTKARDRTGAGKQAIEVSQEEWNAIQAGAISNHQLTEILKHANMEKIKQYATPRTATVMTTSKQTRARSMLASGYSLSEVASQLGVPVSTLTSSLKED